MSAAPSLTPVLPLGQSAEHLKVKLRADLVVQPQFYEGMTHYVIKDPLALKYFRFKIEEYLPAPAVRRQADAPGGQEGVRAEVPAADDLDRGPDAVRGPVARGGDHPDRQRRAGQGADPPPQKESKCEKVWGFLANILFIKIPIIDPEKLLTGMYPYFRWIFTRTFITLSSLSMLLALVLVGSQWKTFYDKLPDFQSFFTWWTIFYFWICLAVVKIIHEFGHGLTAKHYGGEVHEMGILFLVLTPALYCDVTDSWLLPNKWKRIWISAAGIYVECFLASIATFVWWYSTPGMINSLAMATMFICSVNTIMFNANPLLAL